MKEELNNVRILRISDVVNASGVSKTSWYKGVSDGIYPQSINLGGRSKGWVASEVHTVLKAIICGMKQEDIKKLVIELSNQRNKILYVYAGFKD